MGSVSKGSRERKFNAKATQYILGQNAEKREAGAKKEHLVGPWYVSGKGKTNTFSYKTKQSIRKNGVTQFPYSKGGR
jgi:hypothetical protein